MRGNPAVYEQLVALCDRAPPHGAQDSRRATWMLVSLRALRKVAFCGDKTVEDMMLSALSSPNEAVVVAALKGLLALARAPSRPAPPSEGVQNDSMADKVLSVRRHGGWHPRPVESACCRKPGEGNRQSGPSTHADARRHMARGRILPTVGPARGGGGVVQMCARGIAAAALQTSWDRWHTPAELCGADGSRRFGRLPGRAD